LNEVRIPSIYHRAARASRGGPPYFNSSNTTWTFCSSRIGVGVA
jgi:hypothetical protein